eukprot:TRINITY_DN1872_c0_g1_i2.p1 TRINITY_DN1872_c0_g1~~TRINITY_DN1872_c0_g1_i2.p1  ORF type:complete len:287 (-),score=93.45 TRINITY_DN1872_c0_g1_i2:9-869(-)
MIQGGDFTNFNGTGGESIYGEKFEDENFEMKHSSTMLLSMANAGPGTNGSQFFITTSLTPHLDGKHVVFGKVINGFDLVTEIENSQPNEQDKPLVDIAIVDCGELAEGEPDGVLEPEDGDLLPNYPEHARTDFSDRVEVISIAENIRQLGNDYFKNQDFETAVVKYSKAIRYLEYYSGPDEDLSTSTQALLCRSNRAMCYLKLNKEEEAIKDCNNVIVFEPENEKAHFRKITAYIQLKNYEKALEAAKEATKQCPESASISKQTARIKKLIAAAKEKEKKMYSRMF